MIRHTFPAGVMADVLCHDGMSWLAYAVEGAGLFVWLFPDGQPDQADDVMVDASVTSHGFPRLAIAGGAPQVLYRRDQPTEAVVCVDLVVRDVSAWAIPCWGNAPCAWGPDGRYAVQHRDRRILEGFWPHEPTHDAGQAVPTGLSHFHGSRWVTWDEQQQGADPQFQNRVSTDGATVGVTAGDRLVLEIGGVRGTIAGAEGVKQPRIARQADGAYLVAYHVESSNPAEEQVVVLAGVTAADLAAPAPPPTPEPTPLPDGIAWAYPALNRPRAHHAAFFTHGAFGSQGDLIGNTALCIGGQGTTLENELDLAVALGHAIICPADPVVMTTTHAGDRKWYGNIVAYFIHAADRADAERQVIEARIRMASGELGEQPIYVFIDKPAGHPDGWTATAPAWLDDRIWPVVMWFVNQGETPQAARARLGDHARTVARYGRPIGLAVGVYDRGWGDVGVTGALHAVDLAAELGADDHLEVIGYFYFSWARAGGMRDHADIHARALALARTTHDRPSRFGGWVPKGATLLEQVKGLFGQNVPVVEVSPTLKSQIIAAVRTAEAPGPTPTPDPTPQPPAGEPWRDRLDVARAVDQRHPQLLQAARDAGDESLRGAFVDQLAHELNRRDGTDRWGRKARRDGDPSSLNDDALTYRLTSTADKKLVDVVAGDDFRPAWDLRPAHEEPGNGFWHPPIAPDLGPA